jgi:hypothetical protein
MKTTTARLPVLPNDITTCPRCYGDGEEPGSPVNLTDGVAVCIHCDGSGEETRENLKRRKALARHGLEEFTKAAKKNPLQWETFLTDFLNIDDLTEKEFDALCSKLGFDPTEVQIPEE